ncbi:MAG: methyltransferase domain-containing protein [Saprospiraceae bacterium]|nr:methyltransferase domain-containing protein [Saprospiraceae bacterium]
MKRASIVIIYLIFSCRNVSNSVSSDILNSDSLKPLLKNTEVKIIEDEKELKDRTIWQKPFEIIEMLGPLDGKVIADIGAGSGYFSFKFVQTAQKVIAIDIEEDLIQLMNDELNYYKPEIRNKFEARLAKKNDPNLKTKEVDIVFISNTYIYLKDRVKYLKNLRDKLKSGGKVMIIDFKKKITPIGPSQDLRLAQGDVEQDLISAGFQIQLSDDSSLKYQYVIIAHLAKSMIY